MQVADSSFGGLLEGAPDAMVCVDRRGRIARVNAQTERLFGYQRDELVGEPVEILIPEHRGTAHRDGATARHWCFPPAAVTAARSPPRSRCRRSSYRRWPRGHRRGSRRDRTPGTAGRARAAQLARPSVDKLERSTAVNRRRLESRGPARRRGRPGRQQPARRHLELRGVRRATRWPRMARRSTGSRSARTSGRSSWPPAVRPISPVSCWPARRDVVQPQPLDRSEVTTRARPC